MPWDATADRALLEQAVRACEAEITQAFAAVAGRLGLQPYAPEITPLDPAAPAYRLTVGALLDRSPYEELAVDLDWDADDPCPEVRGWIWVGEYVGKGLVDQRQLWDSGAVPTATPEEAAAALRRVAAELCRQLGAIDFTPFVR
jgi:hypothetical protein